MDILGWIVVIIIALQTVFSIYLGFSMHKQFDINNPWTLRPLGMWVLTILKIILIIFLIRWLV